MDEKTSSAEPLHRSIGVAAVLAAVTGAISLLVGALEGEYVGYRRATQMTLAALRDFDRIAPFPSLTFDDPLDAEGKVDTAEFIRLSGVDVRESLAAWRAASDDSAWLAYADAELYDTCKALADELQGFADTLKGNLLKAAPPDARPFPGDVPFAITTSFAMRRNAGGRDVVVSQRETSPDGKAVSFHLTVSSAYKGRHGELRLGKVTVATELEETYIDFFRRLTVISNIKAELWAVGSRGLTRMLVRSVKAKYFVLFWATYLLSALWIAFSLKTRTRKGIVRAAWNCVILVLLMAYEPLTDWLTEYLVFTIHGIDAGWAELVCTIVVWATFGVYTLYYLGLRCLWPALGRRVRVFGA